MIKVGLTGGIGSGKSTVGYLFELLGVPLYKADEAARQLMETSPAVRSQIIELLGQDAYNGMLPNRKYISSVVFGNQLLLRQLNEIIHPLVAADGDRWMLDHADAPYTLKEAAILFESGSWEQLDFVIGVYAPMHLRVKRAMQRDGATEAAIMNRVQQQMDEDEKMSRCRYVIYNDEEKAVIPQVLEVNRLILEQYKHL